MLRGSIQSVDLSKIGCNARDKKKFGVVKGSKLNDFYEEKYSIPIDHEILKNHSLLPKSSF